MDHPNGRRPRGRQSSGKRHKQDVGVGTGQHMDGRRGPGSGGDGLYLPNVRKDGAWGRTLGRRGWEEKQETRREGGLVDWVVGRHRGP